MKALRTGIGSVLFLLALAMNLYASPSLNCGAALGTKFNLEPAANAVPQQFETVDFIPNRIATGHDLVVTGAFDSRGATFAPPGSGSAHWDGSVGGYYVGRASAAGCQPVFEGGLPTITAGGNGFTSNGGVQIAADPARDAFFAADLRYSSVASLSAIGLFRASSTTLLNSTLCPAGTHTEAQAQTCWEAAAPVIIDSTATGGINNAVDFPSVAVDERPTGAGTGAGDVYVAAQIFSVSAGGIALVACTNSALSCSAPVIASSGTVNPLGTGNAQVQVRPDGNITITYVNASNGPLDTLQFVMCKPNGAPKAPTCGAPTVVANEEQSIGPDLDVESLSGSNMLIFSSARHANRLEADGKTVTTFVVWDRCKAYFNFIQEAGYPTCLDADVLMSTSADGGNTWSAATAVNTNVGHQFLPAISTDDSTGTVNIVYYDTEADFLHKRMLVALNQIAPGTTKVGAPVKVTTTLIPWDADPNQTAHPVDFFDFHLGMKARGMGTPGHSRVYTSFTSTGDRRGVYKGQSLPEQNNNLQLLLY